MKKNPIHKYEKETGLKPITGQRAGESILRMQQYNKDGCTVFTEGKERCNPLSFWTDQDIWEYIKQENLEIPPEYEWLDRTGCMFCMFGLARDGTPNRFDKMKEHNPRQYAYCMNNLGIEEFMKYLEENGVL
jgi:3'-phosphoadenosine 5'-phosphosulfate sulfotransferase (PAPS reductase)/FAD synthetase